MKRIFNYLTVFIFAFLIVGVVNVSAKTIAADKIATGSYIIGKHLFTTTGVANPTTKYPGVLTTETIMIAAQSIKSPIVNFGQDLNKMVVYYKDGPNKWVNAINKQVITSVGDFDIDYHNLAKVIESAADLQALINKAVDGEIIYVPAGAYEINLDIVNKKDLKLIGIGNVNIQPLVSRETTEINDIKTLIGSANGSNPIMFIKNSSVELENITIAGGKFWTVDGITSVDSDVTLNNVTIENLYNPTKVDGAQHGRAFTAYGTAANNVVIENSNFVKFNKNAIHLYDVQANITGSYIEGFGTDDYEDRAAQNGIVFMGTAGGTVSGTTFKNIKSSTIGSSKSASSIGILNYYATGVISQSGNTFTNVEKKYYTAGVNTAIELQTAINAAVDGVHTTIYLESKVFDGNFDVPAGKYITFIGNGTDRGSTITSTKPRASIESEVGKGGNGANPIIFIKDSIVEFENLTIKGGTSPKHKSIDGITAVGASVTLNNVDIIDILGVELTGDQYGRGLTAVGKTTDDVITVTNSYFENNQKNAMHFYNIEANISDSVVYGSGAQDQISQNGIVFHTGSFGSVTNTEFDKFEGTKYQGYGIMDFSKQYQNTGNVVLTNNTFGSIDSNLQVYTYAINTASNIQDEVKNASVGAVLEIEEGTYDINLNIIGKDITIKPVSGANVVFKPSKSREAGNNEYKTALITADLDASLTANNIRSLDISNFLPAKSYYGVEAIVYIKNSNVTLQDITIEGGVFNGILSGVDGITSVDSDVTLTRVKVLNIYPNAGQSGVQSGRGFTAFGSPANTITVENSTFKFFNKNGMHFVGIVANISDTIVEGYAEGITSAGFATQNGVLFHVGASGTVNNVNVNRIANGGSGIGGIDNATVTDGNGNSCGTAVTTCWDF